MKKFYLLITMAALMMTVSANAAVESMANLFGKYKFTATVEITADGENKKEHFAAESEVVITKDEQNIYDAQITGFAGAKGSEAMKVNKFDAANNKFVVYNPNGNNYGVFTGSVYMANANGDIPFGGEKQFSDLEFKFNPDTKEITVADFTIVGECDYDALTCKVYAKYTNVKMTLVEAESIDIADLTGEWTVKGAGTDGTMPSSVLPETYKMTLEQNGSEKKYKATIDIEGIAPFTLDATFDGNILAIPFDSLVVDQEKGYYVVMTNSKTPLYGQIDFTFASETSLRSNSPLVIATIVHNEDGTRKLNYIQWWMNGVAKKAESAPAFTWDGKYTLKIANLTMADLTEELPAESEVEITYYEAIDKYYVSKFLGYDVASLTNGGWPIELVADDPNTAKLMLTSAYNAAYLKNASGVFYKVLDINGYSTFLEMKKQEDGTFTLSSFYITKGEYGDEKNPVAVCEGNTLIAASVEPDTFTWDGKFTVKSGNCNNFQTDITLPAEFGMEVTYYEATDAYYVTTFLDENVGNLTYGGWPMTIAADNKSATINLKTGTGAAYIMSKDGLFYQAVDNQGAITTLTMTRNADGTISLSDFYVVRGEYGSTATPTYVAGYGQNVVTKPGEEEVKPQWAGTYSVTATVTPASAGAKSMAKAAADYPSAFEIVIGEPGDYGQLVSSFLFPDFYNLNYGGAPLTVDATDENKASIPGGKFVKSIEPGKLYWAVKDANGGSTINFTRNADGTVSVSPFILYEENFETGAKTDLANYNDVKATQTSTGISAPETVAGEGIQIVDGALVLETVQPVVVVDFAGRIVFQGTTNRVSGLNSGMYIVKTPTAVMKFIAK